MGVLCSGSSGRSVKHRHLISHDRARVSGPSDSGSRSISGDTGEGELRTGSIKVRVHSERYSTRYCDISCTSNIELVNIRTVSGPYLVRVVELGHPTDQRAVMYIVSCSGNHSIICQACKIKTAQ